MVTRRAPFLLVPLLALLLAACGGGGGSTTTGGESAESASSDPGFEAPLVGAEGELASADLEGGPSVLWFWAPWCTTCRAEAPDVNEVQAAFADEVTFVGVAGRGEVGAMEDFVSETATGGFDHVADLDGDIWSSYGVVSQPAFAFVDADGSVEVVAGALGAEGLTAQVEQLTA